MQDISETTDEAMDYVDKAKDLMFEYGPKLIGAIALLLIGLWIIKLILKGIRKAVGKRGIDETLQKFITNLIGWVLKIMLFIAVLGQIGIESTSFIAVLGAAGLAIGLALQGSLANFAGGVLIMLFKPFKVGDLIEGQGELGSVKEIEIFTTKIITPQNKLVIIPNGALSNGNITNYSAEGILTIFHEIGVSYDADIKKTKEVLLSVLNAQEKVLKDPAPMVEVCALADSSVNFAVRPSVQAADYWTVYFDTLEMAKEALDAAGIEIPYPHSVEIQKEG